MDKNIRKLFSLKDGEDKKPKVLEKVEENISFQGPNLWILICAILIASIGLNMNSYAVIIGAMLISPLMGPVVGAGFALGTYDFKLLKVSLKNLLIATLASIIVSTLFFYISPFKEAQSELFSRIYPNFYDVLIAFLGGVVGVIALTRVEKGNPIPGVAIATALLPPLATAGYGIATGNINFFLGALYLYIINSVFIGIATFIMVKYLKYPISTSIPERFQKRTGYIISGLMVIVMIPSIYFAYNLFKQQTFHQNAELFVQEEFNNKGDIIIYKKTDFVSKPKTIELAFLDSEFSEEEIYNLQEKLNKYNLKGTSLIVLQNEDKEQIKNDILNEISYNETLIHEKDIVIQGLQQQLQNYQFDTSQIFKEVRILFPTIQTLSLSRQDEKGFVIMMYQAEDKLSKEDVQKLDKWLQERLGEEEIIILHQEIVEELL